MRLSTAAAYTVSSEAESGVAAGNYELDFVDSLNSGDSKLPDKDHEGHSGWQINQMI